MKIARRENAESDRPTIIDILTARDRFFPDRVAFQFLEDDDASAVMTYHDLDQSARAIAAALQQRFEPGSSVALVFPPGLGFIKAFCGCVYAGVLPIPATYPKPRRPSARLSAIVGDANPSAILTTQRVFETLHDSKISEGLAPQTWLSIDELESTSPRGWQRPEITSSDIAFLQYTSGSTKDPRGVEVSHQNITHNLEMIRQGFGLTPATDGETAEVGVSWLPAYHDMGLIGGILESLYVGGTTLLMSPLSFMRRPERWLRAITEHRAVVSGGPNFAYELCLRKIKPADMEGLDLSSWQVAFSGAEPIRAATLRRFAEVFGPYGFSDSAFYPCYGLAEATLLVTGGIGPGKLTTCSLRAADLQENGRAVASEESDRSESTVELVGCGRPLMEEEVLIVDPSTRLPCDENSVGEIWIRGRNVARGYRNRASGNGTTFSGQLANERQDSFLKSGDLGFLRDGALFVTGRRKELLIIRGRNHYPHDLEATVQASHEKLIPGGGAAFQIEQQDDDLLVLVQEIDRAATPADHESIIGEVRRNVTAEHEVFVHEVILIRTGTLSRTTSGKVRYEDVKRQYLDGELGIVAQWSFLQSKLAKQTDGGKNDPVKVAGLDQLHELTKIEDRDRLTGEIESRLMIWLSQTAEEQKRADLDPNRPFADYGLDSLAAVEFIGQLEEGLGLKLPPTIAWTYPTPAALSRHLSEMMTSDPSADDESDASAPAEDTFDQLLSQLEQMPEDEAAVMLSPEDRPEGRQ